MPASDITIRGAREHNLRDVDLILPRNQLIVMTGVSGSGKSSLAFDTLYAEGQRRYVESLSTYARQFLGQMPKPDVDTITGLAPSISIQQKVTSRNPRSTVGTITEIYDYLRVLYARVGQGHCTKCGEPITAQSVDQILESIDAYPEGTRFQVLAPIVQQQKGEFRDLFADLRKRGYLRARVDGDVVNLADDLGLKKHFKHTIEVVVDRLVAGKGHRTRLAEAIESAVRLSGGSLIVSFADSSGDDSTDMPAERLYSARYACASCGLSFEPPSPQLFSFNSPLGMCQDCNGLGSRHEFQVERLVDNESKSITQGALNLLGTFRKMGRWRKHIYKGAAAAIEQDCSLPRESFLKTPWNELPEEAKTLFLHGMGDRHITFTWRHAGGSWKHGGTWDGFIPDLLDEYRKAGNPMRRRQLEKYMEIVDCSSCGGTRLNAQARNVLITSRSLTPKPPATNGRRRKKTSPQHARLSLPEVCALSIDEAATFFEDLELDATRQLIAEDAIKEIRGRIGFLLKCGLGYLTLDRSAPTLSGGESQRIRLAGQIGCGLVGVLYILDEPSIGLHPRDNDMLLQSLQDLRDQGNTVIVVEHDDETMRAADHIVDFGPGPGVRGGEIVAQGSVDEIESTDRSLTGAYLSGQRRIEVPAERRSPTKKHLKVVGAAHNNLREVDVEFPLGTFICVTGVSGSGKSSLCNDILWQVLNKDINKGNGNPGAHKRVNGLQHLDKAINIDQSPIGRTPRSNPATYVKLLDEIRNLFAKLPQSKMRGYKPGRFSFNVADGRCEACEGHGATKLEMDFLADIWVPCTVCDGNRFNHETLEVRYKDKSIADILDMDVQEALDHFRNQPKILKLLQTLHDVGLDYLKLGQPSPTLSGGEAQRIKLARELGKRSTGKTLYLLDEPTTGLHFEDVRKLLEVLHGFVEAGNTVLVIEHNLDVVKTADWIIDLGPEGGDGGGTIIATGTPEDIAACSDSHTGRALKPVLERDSKPAKPKKKRKTKAAAKPAARTNGNGTTELITIRGAAQHNLQSIDLTVPRDRMSVFCGPSGSGKTSLAMDTLYAEGQRRYVESLSAYARQFLGQMPKPKLEHISGLSPAIAIEQKTVGATPRSTVGTVTEIYDYLRVLFARLGQMYCPDCGVPVIRQTTDEIVDRVMALPEGMRLYIAAPVEIPVGQSYTKLWDRLGTQGYLRVRINGTTYDLDDVPTIDHKREHSVEAIIDRIKVDPESRGRIADSIETALDLGRGILHLVHVDRDIPEDEWQVDRLSLHYSCPSCSGNGGRSFDDLSPQNFSFNSPLGWCDACEGLGVERGTDQQVLVANPNVSLMEGAVSAWPDPQTNPSFNAVLQGLSASFGIPLDVPWYQLEPQHQRVILYGSGRWFDVTPPDGPTFQLQYKGLYPTIEEASRVSYDYRVKFQDLVGEKPCSLCNGDRIRDDAAAVRLKHVTLPQLCRLPLGEAFDFLTKLKLTADQKKIAGDLLNESLHRLRFLNDVGLHYLTLDRGMPTLSGGESQRIRLAGQIGRALTGVLYVLDEPTIGLHPRDNGRLVDALHRLRDLGNTVLLVEHDREVIEAADRLYDFGPGSGRFGGNVVADGTPKQITRKSKSSLTGAYLSGKKSIPVPTQRRLQLRNDVEDQPDSLTERHETPPGEAWLEITGCRQNNLRGVDLPIPLGTLSCVTGLSGSGKSSLVFETLARAVARHLKRQGEAPGPFDELRGVENISRVIVVDQQPLGATPASNPATYTGVFDPIRELFSKLPDAKIRGYKPGRFSFNRAGGRCEECEGLGQKKIEMHFLPDVWVTCDACRGRRYNEETLAVQYRGHSISDVLNLSIGQALELFDNIPKIRAPLATLAAIGLEYLTLGQSATTLSGGEAQRVKLASELCKPNSGRTLYLLDEPTTGLHFDDIAKLLKVLNSLVEHGNTVVVIEHNLDVIKTADWIVDIGPEAGVGGGWIVAAGTPEEVVRQAGKPPETNGDSQRMRSWTAELLAPVLDEHDRGDIEVFDARAVAKKRKGDIDIARVGKDVAMPWKVDGRRWHTDQRVARNGKPCKWEGAALELVVDKLETIKGLKKANWNDQSTVEVTAKKKTGTGWFFHALTGDEWLVRLYFRVPKKTFDPDELAARLDLKPVDEIDELPVYGRGPRVKFNNTKGPFQEVAIDVHWLKEIDTPEFRQFVEEAAAAYLERVEQSGTDTAAIAPWKQLGRKWHLSRKGFPSNRRVGWDAKVLDTLLEQLEATLPDADVDWGNKTLVYFRPSGNGDEVWAEVQTKRRDAVHLQLLSEPGKFALGQVAHLGADREITTHRSGREAVRISFDDVSQVKQADFRKFLEEHATNTVHA
ncbi:UvrABC system protein A [Maioricimonas rarisocia]|uniref:UvrABC system protein A n=1 Tax=Maioricimonas rarisocia TaxID=2528026 RepID=A0A517ZBZ6_9PLAN|nr:excinuclease ABC subunit UvrA [Maioricimonas rarisocia]QDU39982.1 UvrABC system protein A [Maioricimonas rarisocia]